MLLLSLFAAAVNDGDLSLILLILAILAFAGAVYLAVVARNYVGASVAAVIGVIILIVSS